MKENEDRLKRGDEEVVYFGMAGSMEIDCGGGPRLKRKVWFSKHCVNYTEMLVIAWMF